MHTKSALLTAAALLCLSTSNHAQDATPVQPGAYDTSIKKNYVRTWEASAPIKDPNLVMGGAMRDVRQTTQYLDGLGRPLQTVTKGGSLNTGSAAVDWIKAHQYDDLGREVRTFLPFASSGYDGRFKLNPFSEQKAFYDEQLPGQNEGWYYGRSHYETSPLNRVTENFAPGRSWVGTNALTNESERKSVKTKYGTNTSLDEVKHLKVSDVNFKVAITSTQNGQQTVSYSWTVPTSVNTVALMYRALPGGAWNYAHGSPLSPRSWSMPLGTYEYAIQIFWGNGRPSQIVLADYTPSKETEFISSSATFSPGTLNKIITVDENGKQVVEFKDLAGRVVLKKVQLTAVADTGLGASHSGWLSSYYIYDLQGLLRYVVQPRGVELLAANNWDFAALNGDILKEQCFQYEYDGQNRMIVKKVPGAGPVSMVYDKWDRLVMTQDSNLKEQGKWMVTLYDEWNRPVKTGLWANSQTLSDHTIPASASTAYPFTTEPLPTYWELLSETHYDNYNDLPDPLLKSTLVDSGYSASVHPHNTAPLWAEEVSKSGATKGMVTWTRVKVLGTASQFLCTVNLYDAKGRLIQSQTVNQTGGLDILTTQYDFSGKVLVSHLALQNKGTGAPAHRLATRTAYDDLGRVEKVEKKLNGGAWKLVSQLQYDALGQLKTKKLGQKPGAAAGIPLETLTYDYNIRGWLLGANRAYALDSASTAAYFGFDLGYDKELFSLSGTAQRYTTPQYGGNIAGTVWKSTGDDQVRKYDFSYDGINRLTAADFTQFTHKAFSKDAGVDFSVSNLGYDANGNILSMTQRGLKGAQSQTIDSLVYNYLPSSNKLKSVLDHRNDTLTKLGDFRSSTAYMASLGNNKTTAATDYSYDGNGNLVKDLNKDIKNGSDNGITYNHLNLPVQITTTKGTITYTYDAAGTKLQKVVAEMGRPTKTTLYLGGAVYEADTLQFIGHEEGRIRTKSPNKFDTVYYDYFLKDHLGNVRMVLTEESTPASIYQTGMELATRGVDTLLFSGVADTEFSKPDGFDTNDSNAKVARLFSSSTADKRVGPAVVLKVMAGDHFTARVQGWYLPTNTDVTTQSGLTPIVNSLIAAFTGGVAASGVHEGTSQLVTNASLDPSMTRFLDYQSGTEPGAATPKAYLNWILLDEAQFKLVEGNYGAVRIPAITGTAQKQLLQANNGADIEVKKNGYLYVYVSNESKGSVYFDDLRVEHTRGPLLEETHYYPFGLTMAGISSKAAGGLENRKKFIGQELDPELGLNWYQFRFRNHDPQIGRFVQIDPLCDSFVYNSTYAYAENKVGRGFDLEGLELMEFNRMLQAAGINVEQANRNTQARAVELAKKAEPAINVTKDVITITAGVTLLVASGGTAAPLVVGLAGSATVAGGTMKLVFDLQGNSEASSQIPTTLSGTAIFLGNGVSQAATGNKLVSDDVKTVAEFSEGILTLNVTGFDKMNDLQKVSNILSGLSVTLDGLSPELGKALQNILGGNGNNSVIPNQQWPAADNTSVKPSIILPPRSN